MSGFGKQVTDGLSWSLGGVRYQFITTGPENETYSGSIAPILKGSAISVLLPDVKNDTCDFDKIKQVKATGSTLENLPTDPPVPPSDNSAEIQRIKGIVQAQFYTEPSYYKWNINYNQYSQSIYSWSSVPGIIYGAGAFMFAPGFIGGDQAYDLSFSRVQGRLKNRLPECDWPHDSMFVTKSSDEYGSRTFVVMVDASGVFYCWPDNENVYGEFESPYNYQGQNVSVDPDYVKSANPPYPDWAYVPVGNRRDTDWPIGTFSGEPRYAWRFHPHGTKVVGIVLKRETLNDTVVYGKTTDEYANPHFKEVEIDDFKIDATNKVNGSSYVGNIKSDWPGFVEFNITINIVGPNMGDFEFSLSLSRHQEPNADNYIIAAAYLSPAQKPWSEYGVSASIGDLLVLNLEIYRSDRTETWLSRNCGYLGLCTDYIRQSFLKVINKENSAEISSFLTKDVPDDFFISSFMLHKTEHFYTINGKLLHIDLSSLSFAYQASRYEYFLDDNSYYETDDYKVKQRWKKSETGIRYYVFNTIVKQDSNGSDLDLFATIDSTELFAGSIKADIYENNTRWFYSRLSGKYPRHWLANSMINKNADTIIYIEDWSGINTAQVTFWEPDRWYYISLYSNPPRLLATEEQLSNELLAALSKISSGVSGDPIYIFRLNTYEESNGLPHPNTITWKRITSVDKYAYLYTNIKKEFYLGCATSNEGYFDILLDWYQELLDFYNLKGSISWSLSLEYLDTELWSPTATSNPGFSVSFTIYANSLRIFQPLSISKEDAYLSTFNESNILQRVYNYPIGAEIYMREWNSSVESDRNFGLLTHPDGFYAGQLWIPYFTGNIPEGSLFSLKSGGYDYYNEQYYFSFPVDYNLCNTHYTIRDMYFSEENKPEVLQFGFINTDCVGHISGDSTTHSELYATAFSKSLDIKDPIIRVYTGTDVPITYGYYFIEKGVDYNNDTIWSQFSINTFILNAPRFNGAMLFSG